MRAADLLEMLNECRDAKTLEELRDILEALIEHVYFRQLNKEELEK